MGEDLNYNKTQIAFLASLGHFGIAFSSFFVSTVLRHFTARKVLAYHMVLAAVACTVFALSSEFWILSACRFVVGIC